MTVAFFVCSIGGGGAGGVALLFLPAASSVNSDAEPTKYSKATPHMPTSVTASSDFCTTQFVGVEIHASEGGSGNFHQTLGYSAIQRQNFHNYGHGQGSNIGDVTCSSSAATSGNITRTHSSTRTHTNHHQQKHRNLWERDVNFVHLDFTTY